jgi:S1-C subfamily serine protease
MHLPGTTLLALSLLGLTATPAASQALNLDQLAVSVQPVLDVAGPQQRTAIKAVYLIYCAKDSSAGTGFLIARGILITNEHVVGTCREPDLIAIAPTNKRVHFSLVIVDKIRDLALLKPTETLGGGLELANDADPAPGTTVSTWGYPLMYNDTSPLLSVGYVAGFRRENKNGANVKHLIVNGAFNHGNSGGPLLMAGGTKVVGIVVATYHFFPEYVGKVIDDLQKPRGGIYSGFSRTDANGTKTDLSDSQVVGAMLQEFYYRTQVMIGEAISVSELQTLISEKQSELGSLNGHVR